jgi:tRNA(adenine34) deaminase
MIEDIRWMEQALTLAGRAAAAGEVPVGAVLIRDGELIGAGWNRPIAMHDPTAHAEIVAMREGASRLGNYRLVGTTLYVTLEPCLMCTGAMIHARVERLVFGARDSRRGVIDSTAHAFDMQGLNHRLAVQGGVMEQACAEQLRSFFRVRRA